MPKLVIGVSGGLDSTHALIVAARAMDREGRPRSDILGFTLPGFATGERTKTNAVRLMRALGVTWEELDITSTARLMLTELGHPFSRDEPVYDVTFENVQAGLRTDYLFRAANQRGGIVLGTGDLSELALGWCTYGVGDQMSHYNVNGGVPKTLIQHLIRWVVSSKQFDDEVGTVLADVLDTAPGPARRAGDGLRYGNTCGTGRARQHTRSVALRRRARRRGYPRFATDTVNRPREARRMRCSCERLRSGSVSSVGRFTHEADSLRSLRQVPVVRRDQLVDRRRTPRPALVGLGRRRVVQQRRGDLPQPLDPVGPGEQRLVADHGEQDEVLVAFQRML
jgi:NH3-dependent NAD+ synthetase